MKVSSKDGTLWHRRLWIGCWRTKAATKCEKCRRAIKLGQAFYTRNPYSESGCCAQCAGIEEQSEPKPSEVTTEAKATTPEMW